MVAYDPNNPNKYIVNTIPTNITTNTTNTSKPTSIKKYYDYAQQLVDEQALLDKFNAATIAQYNIQREQNRQAENQFYNQMYNSQQTAVDAIRQSNAAAVSTGASRGIQAANELSAILGLQQEAVASATELAQANRQTAQEETAAVLENVLNAYQQAEQQRQSLVSSAIQAASVETEQEGNRLAAEANTLNTLWTAYLQAQANGDGAAAAKIWEDIQKINPNIGKPPVSTNSKYNPVTKSGLQSDGSLAFTTADLNDKNTDNVYDALTEAGYSYASDKQKIIDLTDEEDYDTISQADFNKNKQGGKAGEYIAAIRKDAKNGKIKVGQIVQLNYGDQDSDTNYTYVYLGGTKFAKIDVNAYSDQTSGAPKLYIPKGYSAYSTLDAFLGTTAVSDKWYAKFLRGITGAKKEDFQKWNNSSFNKYYIVKD